MKIKSVKDRNGVRNARSSIIPTVDKKNAVTRLTEWFLLVLVKLWIVERL